MPTPSFPQRQLGRSGLFVSALGLGCMGMSEFYGPRSDEQSLAVIHRCIDLGCTFLDTADMYGLCHNEQLVGKAIKGRRDKVVLATKFGNVRGPDGAFLGVCGKPDYLRRQCDASLKNLGVDVIDLYYQHRVDLDTPIEETISAMADLIKAGKVRYLGMSEALPATIRRAHEVHPIAALQTEYSLFQREPEAEIIPTCRELGIGFVPYSPLGRGLLTGAIRAPDFGPEDNRRNFPRFQAENLDKNLQLLQKIEAIAARKGCTPAQLVLAWLLAQDPSIVPIPGTKKLKYLEENLAAVNISLSHDEVREISDAAPPDAVSGSRYHPWGLKTVNR